MARDFLRTSVIEDMTVRADGSGRIVEAYAVAYNSPAEIRDADGHYTEVILPGAAQRTIAARQLNFEVLWNHGRAIDGRASSAADAIPIGVPLEVTDTERGVYTVTEYLDHPVANSILTAIKKRAIRGQSFSGSFLESRRIKPTKRGDLMTIERSKLDMREYGPVLRPAYAAAEIIGTRSIDQWLLEYAAADETTRAELLGFTLPPLQKASIELEFCAPGEGDPAEPPDPTEGGPQSMPAAASETRHSGRHHFQSLRLAARQKGAVA